MYDIVGKKRWYFLFSALITVPGLIFILLGGLRPTIDFTGGTVWEARYASNPSPQAVQQELVSLGHPETQVTRLGDDYLRIRTSPVDLLPGSTAAPSSSGWTRRRSSLCPRSTSPPPVAWRWVKGRSGCPSREARS